MRVSKPGRVIPDTAPAQKPKAIMTGHAPAGGLKNPKVEERMPEVTLTSQARDPFTFHPGGDHYVKMPIQPVTYIHANDLGFCEGNVVKYVTRWRNKGGLEDLRKAIHYLELLIELEERRDG